MGGLWESPMLGSSTQRAKNWISAAEGTSLWAPLLRLSVKAAGLSSEGPRSLSQALPHSAATELDLTFLEWRHPWKPGDLGERWKGKPHHATSQSHHTQHRSFHPRVLLPTRHTRLLPAHHHASTQPRGPSGQPGSRSWLPVGPLPGAQAAGE